ncbi:UDP-glucuronic acid decarboxylase 4-like protein [Drosera capensis]
MPIWYKPYGEGLYCSKYEYELQFSYLTSVRSCYDEGKRSAETLTMDYYRGADVEVRITRIFNTYGPRMCLDDGRVVSNFVAQTRSFQYVSDLVCHALPEELVVVDYLSASGCFFPT